MIISDSYPNLINGVSQQAEAMRLDSQVEALQNAVCSVVDGLSKRQPTLHVAKLLGTTLTSPFVYLINRDSVERYIVIITNGSLHVFDLAGNPMTLLTPDGTDYLTITNPAYQSFRAVTVEDTTFIVNREKSVAMSGTTSPALPNDALVWIKQGLIGHEYHIDINLTGPVATLTTALTSGQTGITSLACTALSQAIPSGSVVTLKGTNGTQLVSTTATAAQGATSISVTSFTSLYAFNNDTTSTVNVGWGFEFQDSTSTTFVKTTDVASGLVTKIIGALGATFDIHYAENLIHLKRKDGADFTISVYDTYGNQAMSLIKGSVGGVGDLPNKAYPGMLVQVQGDKSSNSDDYYVQFVPDSANTFGTGVWSECVGPGVDLGFDAATMPFILQRTATNTFTLKKAPWALRTCGDGTTAKQPSFVGQPINSMFVYQGRLGVLSGENVVFSQASEFYNFWPTTVTTILDDDRIDYRVGGAGVTALYHAVPFQDRLILFSDQSQLTLTNGDALTAKTVSATVSTVFDGLVDAVPVNCGNSILFAFHRGDYCGIREYFVATTLGSVNDAADVTAHVPRYLEGDAIGISVSTALNMAVVRTTDGGNSLYVYQWLWNGPQKVQSAWNTWVFDGQPIGTAFVSDTLYVVIQRADGVWLEKMLLAQQVDDGSNYMLRMDRRCSATFVSYDSATNTSTFTVPYYASNDLLVANGVKLSVVSITDNGSGGTVVVKGNHTTATAGIAYTFSVTFTRPFVKVPASSGERVTINQARLQVMAFHVRYANTGFFTVTVKPDLYNTFNYDFTGRIIGSSSNIVGQVCIESGVLKIPVSARNQDMTLTIANDTFMPCYLLSAEWTGNQNITSRRY